MWEIDFRRCLFFLVLTLGVLGFASSLTAQTTDCYVNGVGDFICDSPTSMPSATNNTWQAPDNTAVPPSTAKALKRYYSGKPNSPIFFPPPPASKPPQKPPTVEDFTIAHNKGFCANGDATACQWLCDNGFAEYCSPITSGSMPPVSEHAPPPTSPFIVNVTDTGALCNGVTDDTAAIQRAVDQVAANRTDGIGGTVLVPDGICMINALVSVNLKSNVTFKMSSGTVLQAIPNASPNYVILRIGNVTNVNIIGGTLQGERTAHTGSGGEWGMGVGIYGGSNIFVEGVLARDMWGDGFYVAGRATNVTFSGVVADNNRRQGLSIVDANGVIVTGSIFRNTIGAPPQCGIDVEPNHGTSVSNVGILNSQFLSNHNCGLSLNAMSGSIANVRIQGNTFLRNNYGMHIHKTGVSNVTLIDNIGQGVL